MHAILPKPKHIHQLVMSIVAIEFEVELPRIMRRRIIPCHTITNKTSLQNYHFLCFRYIETDMKYMSVVE